MTPTPLVLGTMMFGTTIDPATSFALLDEFVDRGGEWLDTANCYAFWATEDGREGGHSERVLGQWLRERPGMRERVRIATKLGALPAAGGSWPQNREGLSPAAVRRAFDDSLDRLGVDSVDLLWLHMPDFHTPVERTVEAVAELVDAGRVGRVGASNFSAWSVEAARVHATRLGTPPVEAIQLNHTFLQPRPGSMPTDHVFGVLSTEQLDHAHARGLEVWAYSPLMGGAYDNPAKPIPEWHDHPGNARRLDVLTEVAAELGLSRGQVVLAWLAGGDPAVRPILGGSKPEQLRIALDAVATTLPDAVGRRLDLAGEPDGLVRAELERA